MLAFLLILALDATPAQQHPGTWCRVAAYALSGCDARSASPGFCHAFAAWACSFGADGRYGLPAHPFTWPQEWREHGIPEGAVEL